MKNQVKKTTENQNPIDKLGIYGIRGGPGRPKGSRNRFTMIKLQLLEVWEEENGKERFRELFKGSKRDFIRVLDKIMAILLKESKADIDSNEG